VEAWNERTKVRWIRLVRSSVSDMVGFCLLRQALSSIQSFRAGRRAQTLAPASKVSHSILHRKMLGSMRGNKFPITTKATKWERTGSTRPVRYFSIEPHPLIATVSLGVYRQDDLPTMGPPSLQPPNRWTTSPGSTGTSTTDAAGVGTSVGTTNTAGRQGPTKTNNPSSDDAMNGLPIEETTNVPPSNYDTKPSHTTAETKVNGSSAFGQQPPGTAALSGKVNDSTVAGRSPEPAEEKNDEMQQSAATDTEVPAVSPDDEAATNTAADDFKYRETFARILGIGATAAPTDAAVTEDEELQAIASKLLREDETDDKSSSDGSGKEFKGKQKSQKSRGKEKKNDKKSAARSTKKRSSTKTEPERPKRQRKKLSASLDLDDYMDDETFGEIIIKDSRDGGDAVIEPKKKRYSSPAAAPKQVQGQPSPGEEEYVKINDMEEEDIIDDSETTASATPAMEMGEFILKSRADVQAAASLVSRSLANGCWPSPYRSMDPQKIDSRQPSDYVAHSEHMSMVGVAIETFSNDIIAQAIVEELYHCPEEKRAESRAYLATLLNLREVMILNAATIFGPSALLTGTEADFTVIQQSTEESDDYAQVATKLTATLLATSVIIDGLSTLGEETGKEAVAEEITIAFLDMAEKYEYVIGTISWSIIQLVDYIILTLSSPHLAYFWQRWRLGVCRLFATSDGSSGSLLFEPSANARTGTPGLEG
jgi:hypothetical protein